MHADLSIDVVYRLALGEVHDSSAVGARELKLATQTTQPG